MTYERIPGFGVFKDGFTQLCYGSRAFNVGFDVNDFYPVDVKTIMISFY